MQVVHLCDYGIGNTLNVKRAFEKVGAKVHVCKTGSEIENAKILIIPGVGAFSDCMNAFLSLGFEKKIEKLVSNGCWILGICVGMQMLGSTVLSLALQRAWIDQRIGKKSWPRNAI